MKKLNILHINTHDSAGGAAKVAWRLMEAQREAGHNSNILCGIKTTNSPYSFQFDIKKNIQKARECLEQGLLYYEYEGSHELVNHPLVKSADVLHFHNLHGDYFNPVSVSELSKLKPTIWTLHDMQSFTGHCAHSFDCEKWVDGCGNCPDLAIFPEILFDNTNKMWVDKKEIYKQSSLQIICPSDWLRGKVEKSILKQFSPKLIFNGVDTNIFKPLNKELLRKKYGLDSDRLIIGAVAHGGPINNRWKGGLYTHNAMQNVWEKFPNAIFLNIGGGSSSSKDNRIINTGHISNEQELCELYNLLDVFLYTSLADNCPLVILEAIACAIPIVCFSTGGVPELVQHNAGGFVAKYCNQVELDDYLIKLCSDSLLRKQFKEYLVMITPEFDHFKVSCEYDKIYNYVINSRVENMDLHTINLQAKSLAESGDTDKAIQLFEQILTLEPLHFKANFNLGILYYQQKELKKSVKCYLKCLENNPEDRNATINCFYVLKELGKDDEAEKIVSAYLIDHYEDEEMRNLLNGLSSVTTATKKSGKDLKTFDDFQYSKKSHFEYFKMRKYDIELFGKEVDPATCDLKFYQDLLVFAFIKENIPQGSRLLDVGGGNSRILKHFAKEYECWNIDKLEGLGSGPKQITNFPYRMVIDYMGNFNPELPDNYFDFVFSISALEHVGEEKEWHEKICQDIYRVLKSDGWSLHCFDIVLNSYKVETQSKTNWTCGLLPYMFSRYITKNKCFDLNSIYLDSDLFVMSDEAYRKTWEPITKKNYLEFGMPASGNILWQKSESDDVSVSPRQCPKISIVTPSFNQADFLEETIKSVLSQNYPNLEYVIIDGGSTDGSVEIIKKYEKYLKYWHSKPDQGQYFAINEGFKHTSGEIMAWINSDDKYHPDAFKTVADFFTNNPAIQWLTGRPTIWGEIGDPAQVSHILQQWSRDRLLNKFKEEHKFIQQESTFWKRSLWDRAGGYVDTSNQLTGDFELWIRFFRHSELVTIDALLGGFRKHSQQKTYAGKLEQYISLAEQIIDNEVEMDRVKCETEITYKVSAIVSTYNSAEFMHGCMQDLIEQTLFKKGQLEIVVIDSASPQNEKQIVQEFQSKYPNIVYLRTQERETLYAAWNRGIKMARGKYITNANTDDRHRNDALEVLSDFLDQNEAISLVYADSLITETANETFEKNSAVSCYIFPECSLRQALVRQFFGSHPMWRKNVHDTIGYFNPDFVVSGDYDFFSRLVSRLYGYHINEFLSLYCRRKDSVERANKAINVREESTVQKFHRQNCALDSIFPLLYKFKGDLTANEAALLNLGIISWTNGQDAESALFLFKKIVEFNPQSIYALYNITFIYSNIKDIDNFQIYKSLLDKLTTGLDEKSKILTDNSGLIYFQHDILDLSIPYKAGVLEKSYLKNSMSAVMSNTIKNCIAVTHITIAHQMINNHNFSESQKHINLYRKLIDYKSFYSHDKRKIENPKVSVIITAYSTKYDLYKCVESVLSQLGIIAELIIVDNGGNDEIVDSLLEKPVLYIKSPINLLPSEGRNIGCYFAKGEIVAFLDDDAIADHNFIQEIIKCFNNFNIVGLRGKVLPKNKDAHIITLPHYDLGNQNLNINYIDTEGNSAFNKAVYEKMHGMDPSFFGGEGFELSYRINKELPNSQLLYASSVVIYHDYALSSEKNESKQNRHKLMNDYLRYKYNDIDQFRIPVSKPIVEIEEKKSNPFISVCIPTYNRAEYLKYAIQSVLVQKYENYEIVIVDDGSTDHTGQVVASFGSDKIKYFKKENEGRPKARNMLLDKTNGEFVLWLDDDDILAEDLLITYANVLLNDPQVDVIYGDLVAFDDKTQEKVSDFIAKDYSSDSRLILQNIIGGSGITFGGSIMRKSLVVEVGRFDERFLRAQDNELWSRLAVKAKFHKLHKVIYFYRRHSTNVSMNDIHLMDQSYESMVIRNMIKNNSLKTIYCDFDWDLLISKDKAFFSIAQGLFDLKDYYNAKVVLEKANYWWYELSAVLYTKCLACLGCFEQSIMQIDQFLEKFKSEKFRVLGDQVGQLLAINKLLESGMVDLFELEKRIENLRQYIKFYPSLYFYIKAKACSKRIENDEAGKYYLKAVITNPVDVIYYKEAKKIFSENNKQFVIDQAKNRILDPFVFCGETFLKPLVSVIIPTYNRKDRLPFAIRSVLNQTYQNFEILVINDCGDDVIEVIESLNDQRIKYFVQPENKGSAAARNVGLQHAAGDYIAYLDDDDVYYPNHLSTLCEATLKNTEINVFYTDAIERMMKLNGTERVTISEVVRYSIDFDQETLLTKNITPTLCVFHKKCIIGKSGVFDESLKTHEDWDLWLKFSKLGRFLHIKKTTCEYSRVEGGDSLTKNHLHKFYESLHLIYNRYPVFDEKIQVGRINEMQKLINLMQTTAVSSKPVMVSNSAGAKSIKYCIELIKNNEFVKAQTELESLLLNDPLNNNVLFLLCTAAIAQKNDELFLRTYSKLLQLEEQNNSKFVDFELYLKSIVPQKTIFRESANAHKWLDGLSGIEIGAAAHNSFGLNSRNVALRIDSYGYSFLKDYGLVSKIDIEAEMSDIPLESESEDFILSSHAIEHSANFIKTVLEWYRICKVGGYIYVITPKKNACDSHRTLSDWQKIYNDYLNDTKAEKDYHYNVFTIELMKEFFYKIFGNRVELVDLSGSDDKVGNGFTVVYQKKKSLSSSFPWIISNLNSKIKLHLADKIEKTVVGTEKQRSTLNKKISVTYLALDETNHACPFLRVVQANRYLHSLGQIEFEIVRIDRKKDNVIKIKQDALPDLFILQRNIKFGIADAILKFAKQTGIRTIYEIDDFLTLLPDNHPQYNYYQRIRPELESIMRRVDVITVSTEELKNLYNAFNNKVFVLPNLIDTKIWQDRISAKQQRSDGKIVIGCTGSTTHSYDVIFLIPVIKKILQKYPNQVLFKFWGFFHQELKGINGIEFISSYIDGYDQYANRLVNCDFDFALVPLEDNQFNRGKSNIKFLEYAISRIPGVYSKLPPYQAVRNLDTGLLAENTPEQWEMAIELMLKDRLLRQKITNNAYRYASENHTLDKHIQPWLDLYSKLADDEL